MNVLFIAVDDLRLQLGSYGHADMVTPHLDRLAQEARQFNRHYVQVPMCGPSRFALLTSRLPDADEPRTYGNHAAGLLPRGDEPAEPLSLPHLFKRHGYTTVNLGKISHNPDGRNRDGSFELPFSWDEAYVPAGAWGTPWDAFFAYAGGRTRDPGKTPATEAADVPDIGYPDGLIAREAVRKLQQLQAADQPFFLAVGFFKPHLPFNAPRKYWEFYDPDQIALAENPFTPENVDPRISLHASWELTPRYTGLQTPGVVADAEARHLRHAYNAAVSYIDAQIGLVLDELDRLGLADNTIVVVWGDHGWHLGEHGIWGKHTLFEAALHSPLMIRTPDLAEPGVASDRVVETIDIYPTLAELCRLPVPSGVQGQSLVPILNDPSAHDDQANLARSYWTVHGLFGQSLRTDRYRLTVWTDPKQQQVVQIELYDHQSDQAENVNIAADEPQTVEQLRLLMDLPANAAGATSGSSTQESR